MPDTTTTDAPETPGRREANRQRTRSAIVSAVRTLGDERGLGGLTVDEVAEAADVSRRTFHNYFPNVPAVVAAAMVDLLAPLGQKFLERPADEHPLESARIILDIPDELLAWLRIFPEGDEHVAMKIQMESDHQIDAWLRGLMAQRMGPEAMADEIHVRVLTATLHGAFDAAATAWLEQTGGALTPAGREVFTRSFKHGLTLAMHGFAPAAPAPHPTPDRPTASGHPTSDPVPGSSTKG